MNLNVGSIRNNIDGFEEIARLYNSSRHLKYDLIELDFEQCEFFEANMAAALYSIISRLYEELNSVKLQNIPQNIKQVLCRNRLLAEFGFQIEKDTYQTTIPFKKFKKNANEQFLEYLKYYLRGRGIPKMSGELSKRFKQSLLEIFQNSGSHSCHGINIFSCGQYFPNKERFDFSISDSGIGIRENVRKFFKNDKISSKQAIEWALKEGHSTRTFKQPSGIGLKLIKDFLNLNKGKLQVISRFGYYEFSQKDEQLKKMKYDFPGTCVNIEINTADEYSYKMETE
ncbi:ATP-binding protein [Sedimentisphaera salicampi]|uniref:Histidine kinase-, DNA gyrase B-, and HSP90-like ATPase n=1 Tax=Sedimentisphaera salicampi TaxID=1941349 RepID=A0A1W6LKR5_9BACT|nr:ATP-binding protein [Sedimentisphaera salicampi]ARN56346.1 hypothetical protein STSP1_00726 [Sedimentisphaera salicampi]